ncbi:MAG TPA: hypothetical protein VNZ62_05370 [Capillimicrobium sp.]|nr:hypothetical protein [Capillimicrobium sp.]
MSNAIGDGSQGAPAADARHLARLQARALQAASAHGAGRDGSAAAMAAHAAQLCAVAAEASSTGVADEALRALDAAAVR